MKDFVPKILGDKVVCEIWCVKDGVSKMAPAAGQRRPRGGAGACVGAAGPRLAFAWQAQRREPSGGAGAGGVHRAFWRAGARMGAAGPRLGFVREAEDTAPAGGAGARVGASWPAAGFRVAGAVHRAFWTSWCVRGRRWSAAGFHVAGAVHRAFWRSWCARGRQLARGWLSCGRRSTQSLPHQLLQKALCTAPAT